MTSIGKALLFGAAVSILFTAGVRAQTVAAASCNASDVQTALNSVTQASATVSIPAGTCTWTSAISYTIPSNVTTLTIQGAGAEYAATGGSGTAGTDETVFTDKISSGNPALDITARSGQSLRITAIAFIQPSSGGTVAGNGMVSVEGSSTAVRIDHCHFYSYVSGNKDVYVGGTVTGVADHNFFDALSGIVTNDIGVYNGSGWNGLSDSAGYGNASWAVADNFGSSQFFFDEDDFFRNGWVSDCSVGGRFVIRHSTMTAANGMAIHGISGSAYRGCRAAEIYDNTVNNQSDFGGGIVEPNSGAFLVWGNTVTNYDNVIQLSIERQSNQTYPETAPPNGWGYCGSAQTGAASVWDGNVTSNGYPCIDSPGRGKGDLITGGAFPSIIDSIAGGQTWPHQALDPIYVWDNNFTPGKSIVGDNTNGNLADNRDYYQQFGTYGESGSWNGSAGINQSSSAPSGNCTAGSDPMTGASAPGVGWWDTSNNTLYVCNPTNTWTAYYTPYTYPHPLTQSTSAVNPPTNLSATAH